MKISGNNAVRIHFFNAQSNRTDYINHINVRYDDNMVILSDKIIHILLYMQCEEYR